MQLVSTWKQHKEKKSRYGGFALKKKKEMQGLTKQLDDTRAGVCTSVVCW
jgi:hypothetical protein